MMIQA